jgi:hypothetical protein
MLRFADPDNRSFVRLFKCYNLIKTQRKVLLLCFTSSPPKLLNGKEGKGMGQRSAGEAARGWGRVGIVVEDGVDVVWAWTQV